MKTEEKAILSRCLVLTAQIAASKPPEHLRWSYMGWLQQAAYGPRYGVSAWFGAVTEAERKRFRRALDSLEQAGLVTLHREAGVRLSNVELTEAGEAAAKELEGTSDAS